MLDSMQAMQRNFGRAKECPVVVDQLYVVQTTLCGGAVDYQLKDIVVDRALNPNAVVDKDSFVVNVEPVLNPGTSWGFNLGSRSHEFKRAGKKCQLVINDFKLTPIEGRLQFIVQKVARSGNDRKDIKVDFDPETLAFIDHDNPGVTKWNASILAVANCLKHNVKEFSKLFVLNEPGSFVSADSIREDPETLALTTNHSPDPDASAPKTNGRPPSSSSKAKKPRKKSADKTLGFDCDDELVPYELLRPNGSGWKSKVPKSLVSEQLRMEMDAERLYLEFMRKKYERELAGLPPLPEPMTGPTPELLEELEPQSVSALELITYDAFKEYLRNAPVGERLYALDIIAEITNDTITVKTHDFGDAVKKLHGFNRNISSKQPLEGFTITQESRSKPLQLRSGQNVHATKMPSYLKEKHHE